LRESLEALAGDGVTFRGHVDDASEELDTASALLLTSRYEGQSLAVTEALAHGCPAIAYDVHYGPGELIAEGRTGHLVPAGDTSTLARRILDLLDDPTEVARMSRNAWDWARAHDPAAAMAAWADLFSHILTTRTAKVN
jgi:poly(glycerol-phosphate) alpha-glucosyltransferase